MLIRSFVLSAFIALNLPSIALAQAPGGTSDCQAMLPLMRHSHIPHLALASFEHGAMRASYCSLDGSALGADSVFVAASLGKPLFAAAVLALVEEGRLDLDRPLREYMSDDYRHSQNAFRRDAPTDIVSDPRMRRVTARMVLAHTSGLPNWARGSALDFRFEPGSAWGYSGEAYVYLQHVVESISGQSLDEFVRQRVFEPLGMTDSGYGWDERFGGRLIAGHDARGAVQDIGHEQVRLAAATLHTTLADYARFVAALLKQEPGSVFAREAERQVTAQRRSGLDWGLGVGIEASTGSLLHWGATPGYQSMFFIQPARQRGVLFLSDSDNGLDLVDFAVARYVPGVHPALRFPMLHPKD